MSRLQAMANRVSDGLLSALQGIGTDSGSAWLTRPKKVQRGVAVDVATLPKPGIFILTNGWETEPLPRSGAAVFSGRATAKYTALCCIDRPVTHALAEKELNDLAADVITAVGLDYQLGGVLTSGYAYVTGYTPEVDLSGEGFAVASVDITATWTWDTDSA